MMGAGAILRLGGYLEARGYLYLPHSLIRSWLQPMQPIDHYTHRREIGRGRERVISYRPTMGLDRLHRLHRLHGGYDSPQHTKGP